MKAGRFTLPRRSVIEQHLEVKLIMSQCVILRCEMMAVTDRFEYHALSWRFRDSPDYCVSPEYEWVYDNKTGTLSVLEV